MRIVSFFTSGSSFSTVCFSQNWIRDENGTGIVPPTPVKENPLITISEKCKNEIFGESAERLAIFFESELPRTTRTGRSASLKKGIILFEGLNNEFESPAITSRSGFKFEMVSSIEETLFLRP